MGNKTETVGTGIIREEEIIPTMEGTQTTADTQTTTATLIMGDTLIMEDTLIMVDTLIMEDIPITEVIQVTVLIVGNCNPSLVEVEHLALMMTEILPSPLKGDETIHFRVCVMKFVSTQKCDK